MHLFDACSKHHIETIFKSVEEKTRELSPIIDVCPRSFEISISNIDTSFFEPDSNRFSSRKRGWNLGVGRNGSKGEGRDFYRRRAEQFALLHAGPIPAEIKSREIVKSLAALTQRVTG